jgi:hypothetical protein
MAKTSNKMVVHPPHANAAVHKRIMKRLDDMSADERRKVLVRAGILTKGGKLAKPYRPQDDEKGTEGSVS